jgi:hypothetical protein
MCSIKINVPSTEAITFNYVHEMRWKLIVKGGEKLTGGLVRLTSRRQDAVLVV